MAKYKVIRRRCEKVTGQFVFPVAIVWEPQSLYRVDPVAALSVYFLCWSWEWLIKKDGEGDA